MAAEPKRLRAHVAPLQHTSGTLLQKTRQFLIARKDLTYLAIYSATGLDPSWLAHFASGRLKEPGVNKVQKLYEFLTGKHLEV